MKSSPISYILGSTVSGPMIMNRWDSRGVANEMLALGSHEHNEILGMLDMIDIWKSWGRTVMIDGGANIGGWTIAFAKAMAGWGEVYSFEPQRRLYYALCGNVALNNCHNVHARNQALGSTCSIIDVPQLPVDSDNAMSVLNLENPPGGSAPRESVPIVTIDSLGLNVGFIKLDIEGMEPKALLGAKQTIERCRPIIFAEVWMHGNETLRDLLPGYREQSYPGEPRNSIFHPE